jgi:putative ABC transport system ATP-binding protein
MFIEATDLSKTYQDRRGHHVPVLKGVSINIGPGEFVSLSGPSGCGKSTLLNLLGCLDRPDSGTYKLDGQDVLSWNERQRADLRNRRIGFVFQSFHLLPFLTVEGNVTLPLIYSRSQSSSGRKAEDVLRDVDLQGMAHRYPAELSGGQQQRVAIARALIQGADVILADEPTGNLDPDTAQSILDVFARLVHEGKTVLLVTHDHTVAGRAARRLRLESGRITSDERSTGVSR